MDYRNKCLVPRIFSLPTGGIENAATTFPIAEGDQGIHGGRTWIRTMDLVIISDAL